MIEHFLNLPVIVETPLGPIVGVLVQADTSGHGGIGSLLIHAFIGSWVLVKTWSAIKTARSYT